MKEYFDIDNNTHLRTLSLSDAPALLKRVQENREYLRRWLPWVDGTKVVKDVEDFIKANILQTESNQGIHAGIFWENNIVGMIGHHQIAWNNKFTSLGYWLAEDFTGKGIMTRACKTIIDYSFKDLNLNRIEIGAAVENKASRAIPERLGFKLEGILRQREWLYDHFVDHALYSILKSEWK
jgi:ribosomal-protein-serine acetyltransferase